MYEVKLLFGKAFIKSEGILGAEQLSNQALYAIGVTKGAGKDGKDLIFNGVVMSDYDR